MTYIRLFVVLLLFFPSVLLAETLPFSQDFEGTGAATWISTNELSSNDSAVTLAAGEGWGGGDAAKLVGPTVCPVEGGNNGGATRLVIAADGTPSIVYIRYLLRIEDSFFPNWNTSDCGGFDLKHMIATGTAQRVISSMKVRSDSLSTEVIGISLCQNSTCRYENGEGPDPDDGDWWPTSATQTLNFWDRTEEWISIEYGLNTVTGLNSMWIHTSDGEVSGLFKQYYIDTGGGYSGLEIGSFFNHKLSSQTDAAFYVDEIEVSTSYIGPPDGFVSSGGSTGIYGSFTIGGN